ncbi:MAG: metallophosphoesterase family protein [Caldilineaceae bacterium]|nr:metallophosphoesterase family protein [Caldilineaceae bacterium]
MDDWYTPDEPTRLHQLASQVMADVIVLGHTHQPFIDTVEAAPGHQTLFVNPGAVGRSLDGDTRAAYAILQTEPLQADLHRIAYDLNATVQAIFQSGMPPAIGHLLQQGLRRVEQLPPDLLHQLSNEPIRMDSA